MNARTLPEGDWAGIARNPLVRSAEPCGGNCDARLECRGSDPEFDKLPFFEAVRGHDRYGRS